MKTSTVTTSFYYVFNISLYCYDTIPSFIGNLWRVLLLGNYLKRLCFCMLIGLKHEKNNTVFLKEFCTQVALFRHTDRARKLGRGHKQSRGK